MAKAATTPAPPPKDKKRSAASEIDDIFLNPSKKSKPPADAPSATAGPAADADGAKKAKKGKKGKAAAAGEGKDEVAATTKTGEDEASQPKKRVPVEVVDTSKTIEAYKPQEAPVVKALGANATEVEKKAAEEEERFMDSRGTRRRTDDGLPIYDTAELKIGLGGNTELCPFDCDCCF
ncbi:hypothetical protein JCM10207_001017 [Rhodosporidiobolus poonsookiae]